VRFFYPYPRAPQQSQDVPAAAGCLSDKAAELGAAIKNTKELHFMQFNILKTEITALLCQQVMKITSIYQLLILT
jgi:hypothetical protein